MERKGAVAGMAGLALAAGSGILYGSINVLSKPLQAHPLAKGWIAYLASALVLAPSLRGFRIAKGDVPKVLAMGLSGAAVAPALLFHGLERTAAADAGILLTLELVVTTLLAFAFLGERFHAREGLGLAALLGAALCVYGASAGGEGESTLAGALLVLGAAAAWGVDNAVSARLVGAYGVRQLIAVKGFIGATALLLAAVAVRAPLPAPGPAAWMVLLGIASIAVSSVLFYTALRRVGAARSSAMNIATTGLVGALGGVLLLSEHLSWWHGLSIALLALGTTALAWRDDDRDQDRRGRDGPDDADDGEGREPPSPT
ncbi:MAG TPA: DMT family transporter [Candidatus Thermoplasmatota archaeon]|nr:DMT family transporter [Candidatus Thermoplasmatota archaeon]